MNRAVLAVDIGTSSLKAALIDETGTVLAASRCRFPETRRTGEDWILALADAVTILAPGKSLAALAISGNGPTVTTIGSGGLGGPVLLWNDPVPFAGDGPQPNLAPPTRSLFIPRLAAYAKRWPGEWNAARFALSGPEYLVWALTGEAVTILPESRFVEAYWSPEELAAAGLEPSRLAPFVPAGATVGYTGKGPASAKIRLPPGIPVVTGGPDFFVALVGTGTLEAGTACDRAGTSEGLNVCTDEPVSAPLVRPLPGVLPGLWNAACLLPDTGAVFHEWRKASGQTGRPYPEIMRDILASDVFPAPGEPIHPGRTLVEGIGFSVREAIARLRESTGLDPVWRLSGGQARNGLWNEMKADITGSIFEVTATPDGELMGDAMLAFSALGAFGSLREAAGAMVRATRRFEPHPIRTRAYAEKYETWKAER